MFSNGRSIARSEGGEEDSNYFRVPSLGSLESSDSPCKHVKERLARTTVKNIGECGGEDSVSTCIDGADGGPGALPEFPVWRVMKESLWVAITIGIWLALQLWLLPKLGVKT